MESFLPRLNIARVPLARFRLSSCQLKGIGFLCLLP
nr:MAG TPA: hypothetical protein [Crassvirales sp.]